jgi:uncharacterized protein YegL
MEREIYKNTNLIDISRSILSKNIVEFDPTISFNVETISTSPQTFGILNVKSITSNETTDEIDILLIVDCSGSMSDKCSDGKNKMQHIIYTLKNIVNFIHKHPNVNIHVTIFAFDTTIYNIVERTRITRDNLPKILMNIDQLKPLGSTDIELALKYTKDEIVKLTDNFPNTIIYPIIMTDGQATEGCTNHQFLQELVDPTILNTFIGFGLQHDASLLHHLSSVGKSEYYFIDKIENAGLIYGEILHGILYKLITNVKIFIENGLIYDYKNNSWVNTLEIPDIVSEANKVFNIISTDTENCKIFVKGNVGDLITVFPAIINEEPTNLKNHLYRQRTLELLYEVNNLNKQQKQLKRNIFDTIDNIDTFTDNPPFLHENKSIKLKLNNLFDELKKYIMENNLENDIMLKRLCDDIYISLRTFGTEYGMMYSTSRQSSQGSQRQYTASKPTINVTNYCRVPCLQRQTNDPLNTLDSLDALDWKSVEVEIAEGVNSNLYLSEQATQIMHEINSKT